MIEAAQEPFGPRDRIEVVEKRDRQRCKQSCSVDGGGRKLAAGAPKRRIEDQCGDADERGGKTDAVHDAVGNQFRAVIVPFDASEFHAIPLPGLCLFLGHARSCRAIIAILPQPWAAAKIWWRGESINFCNALQQSHDISAECAGPCSQARR
ncbi:hypothetical protein D9M70_515010 [compost metagenome]